MLAQTASRSPAEQPSVLSPVAQPWMHRVLTRLAPRRTSPASTALRRLAAMSTTITDDATVPRHARVAIIGSGPAAHACAIYLARAEMRPIMFEGFMAGGVAAGGQLTTTTEVENYPGFDDGISGPALMDKMRVQSVKYGTRIYSETITRLDASQRPFRLHREDMDAAEEVVEADAVIIATGATARRMHLPGEDTYWQHGISACAVCDGALPLFRSQALAVIGGGDSACEEALFLTRFASKVHLLVRRDKMRASRVMQKRTLAHPKIEMHWCTAAVEAVGDGRALRSLVLKDTVTGELKPAQLDVRGLFYGIGHDPNTAFLRDTAALSSPVVKLDTEGYIVAGALSPGHDWNGKGATGTSVEGVFACGDVVDKRYRQAITAAGDGCRAALDCVSWLESQEETDE